MIRTKVKICLKGDPEKAPFSMIKKNIMDYSQELNSHNKKTTSQTPESNQVTLTVCEANTKKEDTEENKLLLEQLLSDEEYELNSGISLILNNCVNNDCSNNQPDEDHINVYIIHEMQELSELKKLLAQINEMRNNSRATKCCANSTSKPCTESPVPVILLTFDSQESSKSRKYGFKSSTQLALQQKVLLRELNLEYINSTDGMIDIKSILNNLVFFASNGGESSSNPQLKKVWNRYLHANANIKEYQRLFTKSGALFTQTSDMNLVPNEKTTNFPVSLINLELPKELDSRMRKLTKEQTELWAKISGDFEWQKKCISQVGEFDPLMTKLLEIAENVKDAPHRNPVRLTMARNDFMVEKQDSQYQVYQVEYNLIASGMGPICEEIKKVHIILNSMEHGSSVTQDDKTLQNTKCFSQALETAHQLYGVQDAIIVKVNQSFDKNQYDQLFPVEYLAHKGILYQSYSFQELLDLGEYEESTGKFRVLGKEVALFYFRDGYLDHQYTPEFWKLREVIEKSAAIKCPDVFTQITNLKYFQYMINQQKTWEHFYGENKSTISKFNYNKASFCDIFTFEDFNNSPELMKKYILGNGGYHSFVLKPQKEGGANNYFGLDIMNMLDTASVEDLKSHILMRRINPM